MRITLENQILNNVIPFTVRGPYQLPITVKKQQTFDQTFRQHNNGKVYIRVIFSLKLVTYCYPFDYLK